MTPIPPSRPEPEAAYLSLREAAERLGVAYHTVYRMVRDGSLPALRVRGVWRIPAQDLEARLRHGPAVVAGAGMVAGTGAAKLEADTLSDDRCAACGRPLASVLSLGGRCDDCQAPLCVGCWSVEGRRHCAAHQPAAAGAAAAHVDATCGACGRSLQNVAQVGGRCREDGCLRPICLDCWQLAPACMDHAADSDAALAEARQRLARGEIAVLVTCLEARGREMAYLARFDQKLGAVTTLRHPVDGRVLAGDGSGWAHQRSDERSTLLDALHVGYLDRALEARLPLNGHSRYSLPQAPGGPPALVIEAVVVSDLAAHARFGFSAEPLSLPQLLQRLQALAEAAQSDAPALLTGIASTTGFTAEAVAYLCGAADGSGGYSHQRLLPCLIDLSAANIAQGQVLYNPAETRLVPFVELFAPRLPAEDVQRISEHVAARLQVVDYLTARDVAAELALPLDRVQTAFRRLATGIGARLDELPDVGLVIMRRS